MAAAAARGRRRFLGAVLYSGSSHPSCSTAAPSSRSRTSRIPPVEYTEYFSGQTSYAVAESPKEALPHSCRPDFGAAWSTTLKFKTDQKLRLCDICGAFLSVYDSDRRVADHFGGKLHMGYMLIRERLSELQEEKNKKAKVRPS